MPMKPKTKRQLLVFIAACLVGAVALIAAAWLYLVATVELFPPRDYNNSYGDDTAALVRGVQSRLGSWKLPSPVEDLRWYADFGINPTQWIAFRTTPEGIRSFRQQFRSPWTGSVPNLPRTPPQEIATWWQIPKASVLVNWLDSSEPKGLHGVLVIICESSGTVLVMLYSS